MPTFYQRPLTWLFWIAAACLDAVALSINHEGDFATSLALGQLMVVSGWLVLGKSHPLSRATWFIVAIALLLAPDYVIPRLRSGFYRDLVWPHVLGELIALGAFTALMTGVIFATLWGLSRPGEHRPPSKLQFPVSTLFGWMVVLAAASSGLRIADFSLIDDNLNELALGCSLALVAATMMATMLGDYQATWLTHFSSLLGISASLALAFAVGVPPGLLEIYLGAWGFVAGWILVTRLDARFQANVTQRSAEAVLPTSPLQLLADES